MHDLKTLLKNLLPVWCLPVRSVLFSHFSGVFWNTETLMTSLQPPHRLWNSKLSERRATHVNLGAHRTDLVVWSTLHWTLQPVKPQKLEYQLYMCVWGEVRVCVLTFLFPVWSVLGSDSLSLDTHCNAIFSTWPLCSPETMIFIIVLLQLLY